jgi:hypothetical protein
VVGLPDSVGCGGFPTMNQFERVAVCLRALVSKGEQIRREVGNDAIDDSIARRLFT